MADTIEQLAREESSGDIWKNRHKKWPTMSTLMHQSEITVQPYTLDYTDPHEIMAYRAYDIPDWDGISQASWTAAKSIDQEMTGSYSTPKDTKGKERRREKTCRHVLCVFLVLSVVMATAAAVGLTVFLNLHDHGLAEHRHHHHGNHIHANITTEQGIRLSNMFCNVVKRILRGADFPVDSGLQSCHTALLFIENSEDVHIEMHVSPKMGYTIKEKLLRALESQLKTNRNNRFKDKEKLKPNSMHERGNNYSASGPKAKPPLQKITTEKNEHVISATGRQDLASSEYASNSAKATTLPPVITKSHQTVAKFVPEDKTTTLHTSISSHVPGKSVNSELDKTSVSPDSFGHRLAESGMERVNISPTSSPNVVDNESIRANMGNFLESTSLSHSVKLLTSATFDPLEKSTPPSTVTLENRPKPQTTTSFLGKATSLPPKIFKHDLMMVMTSSLEETTTFPPIIFDDNSQPSSDQTTALPPIILEHGTNQQTENSLYKAASLPPITFNDNSQSSSDQTTVLPPINFEHGTNQQVENSLYKTASLPPITFEDNSQSSSDQTTVLPPINFEHDTNQQVENSLYKTASLPPITFEDNSQSSSDQTTVLPPINFEHDTNQQVENSLYKTASLPPIFIDIDQNMPTKVFTDKTTNETVKTEIDKIPTSINSTSQPRYIITTTSPVLSSRSDVENLSQKVKPGEIIPVATKLFNPELLDLTNSNLIPGAVNTQEMNTRKNQSPKIVESLMSGGVVKLPFKTNSNFRFLFSSDPKVRSINTETNEIANRKEEAPNIQNSNKVKNSEKEFIDNNTSYKSRQPSSNVFTEKPKSPELFRTIMLPTQSTKSFIQRRKDLSKKPKRRLDLTEFGETRLKFK